PWTGGPSRYSSEGATILGYDAAELVISNADFYERIVHPDELARLRAIGERVARRREPGYSVEYRIVRPDGAVRDLQEIGENVFDASGRIVAAAGTIQDVTERKRLEGKLQQAQEMEVVACIPRRCRPRPKHSPHGSLRQRGGAGAGAGGRPGGPPAAPHTPRAPPPRGLSGDPAAVLRPPAAARAEADRCERPDRGHAAAV